MAIKISQQELRILSIIKSLEMDVYGAIPTRILKVARREYPGLSAGKLNRIIIGLHRKQLINVNDKKLWWNKSDLKQFLPRDRFNFKVRSQLAAAA